MENLLSNQRYSALAKAGTPSFVRSLAKKLGILFFGIPVVMLFFPWQQNIVAHGSVTAYAPVERRQTVDAPVKGIIQKWHVQEGTKVKAGDVLLEIRDLDPLYKERLQAQLEASQTKLEAKEDELQAYMVQLQSLLTARDAKIAAAQYKLDVARQKALASSESIVSSEATVEAAGSQLSRMKRLLDDGLVSRRDVEIAERDAIIARRQLNSTKAQYESALAEEKTARAELQQIRADAQASIDAANAVINKIRGEIADSRNSLATAATNLSRQTAQQVKAPRDGTVFRVAVNSQAQVISQGQPLLVIVPDTQQRAVELMVDGRDAALISPGSDVRLEFEGWPAIQVPGWPQVALGTFGGEVAFVDTADDGTGQFRVMVVPDESLQEWPSDRFLRQGVSAQGWIMLREVSIGYEIWRVLNGFPPRLPQSPAAKPVDSAGKSAPTV